MIELPEKKIQVDTLDFESPLRIWPSPFKCGICGFSLAKSAADLINECFTKPYRWVIALEEVPLHLRLKYILRFRARLSSSDTILSTIASI